MAAALARRVSGLLRPLSVSLVARTPQLCKLSILLQPPPLYSSAAAALRAPQPAAVCQTPRYNLLQRGACVYSSAAAAPSLALKLRRWGQIEEHASLPRCSANLRIPLNIPHRSFKAPTFFIWDGPIPNITPFYQSLTFKRVSALIPSVTQQPSRSLTYVSLKKGKRKSVKSVTDRFMRLHCDLWIRRKAGYKKKLWKKKPARRKRLRELVFCNKTQSKLFDKMTTSFWKRRNWFVNDPYLKYHDRVNLKL